MKVRDAQEFVVRSFVRDRFSTRRLKQLLQHGNCLFNQANVDRKINFSDELGGLLINEYIGVIKASRDKKLT